MQHENDPMRNGHDCVLPFDSDHQEFSRGFEAGALWARLQERPDESLSQVVHAANAEMSLRIADALGRPIIGDELDAVWLELTFGPVDDAGPLHQQ